MNSSAWPTRPAYQSFLAYRGQACRCRVTRGGACRKQDATCRNLAYRGGGPCRDGACPCQGGGAAVPAGHVPNQDADPDLVPNWDADPDVLVPNRDADQAGRVPNLDGVHDLDLAPNWDADLDLVPNWDADRDLEPSWGEHQVRSS